MHTDLPPPGQTPPQSLLGLIAGGGDLPRRLAQASQQQGRAVRVAALKGHADPEQIADLPHRWFRLGNAANILDWMRAEGVGAICMIGPVRRPSLLEIMPDLPTARLLTRIGFNALGDDGLLRALTREINNAGFDVLGAHQIMGSLLAQPGLLAGPAPDLAAQADIAKGREVARLLGSLDVGQGAVVQQGLVLAVEAIEGTDAMLARAGQLRREGPGGVLVKVRKPQQDMRLDLPTIGTTTLIHAAAAGLRGIAIEANGALVVDPQAIKQKAETLGLFVQVLE